MRQACESLHQLPDPVDILYLITELSVVGGAEIVLARFLARLNRQRFRPTVACLYGGEGVVAQEIRNLGIPVIDLGMTAKWRVDALWRLSRYLRDSKPIILHNSMYHANVVGRLMGRLVSVPIVISWRHNVNIGGKVREQINRWTAALDDCTITVSDTVRQVEITNAHRTPEKVVTVYNGIVPEMYVSDQKQALLMRRTLGVEVDTLVLGTVGRMDRQKDFANLIRAAKMVHERVRNIHLLLIGDGELRPELSTLADQLGVSQYATFAGIRHDVPELLAALDVFVLPSRWEGHPLAILEAMATGLPVVATSVGGVPEVVKNGETGLLVPPENSTALAEAILQLVEPETRQRFGIAARQYVAERFSIAKMSAQIEALYRELLTDKGFV